MGEDEIQRTWKDYLRICIIWILKSSLQSTSVALVVFREVIIWRRCGDGIGNLKIERLQVRV